MIFVTVGTHEQPFDRLLQYMDRFIEEENLNEKIVCQSGYSKYQPRHYTAKKFFSYNEMHQIINDADIIITHGGPSSFIAVLTVGKIPIVVPRQKKYDEHVNDHQVDFCRKIKEKGSPIVLAENYDDFKRAVKLHKSINAKSDKSFKSNNGKFCSELEERIEKII